jgi:hypothetical protein
MMKVEAKKACCNARSCAPCNRLGHVHMVARSVDGAKKRVLCLLPLNRAEFEGPKASRQGQVRINVVKLGLLLVRVDGSVPRCKALACLAEVRQAPDAGLRLDAHANFNIV